MTKCTACEIEECERSYANKGKCVGTIESIDCSCTCRVSIAEEIGASVASVGAGIAAVVGGVVITAATEGAALAVGGGALIGAGSSLIVNPIQKKITGESMSWSDVTTDAVVGAAIGAITGPIGSVLSGVAKGSSEVVKGGVRVGAGAIAGRDIREVLLSNKIFIAFDNSQVLLVKLFQKLQEPFKVKKFQQSHMPKQLQSVRLLARLEGLQRTSEATHRNIYQKELDKLRLALVCKQPQRPQLMLVCSTLKVVKLI